jgi:ankyrin repeat protein
VGSGERSRVFEAVLASDAESLRAAIAAGDDLDAWDHLGMTPLLYAAFRNDIDAVALLLRGEANPSRPNRDDHTCTPLWHARDDFGLFDIAAMLENAGAKTHPDA